MWSIRNEKNNKKREGFLNQDDAENFIVEHFGERANITDCDEENKEVIYELKSA
jgi:hypothetical protein